MVHLELIFENSVRCGGTNFIFILIIHEYLLVPVSSIEKMFILLNQIALAPL